MGVRADGGALFSFSLFREDFEELLPDFNSPRRLTRDTGASGFAVFFELLLRLFERDRRDFERFRPLSLLEASRFRDLESNFESFARDSFCVRDRDRDMRFPSIFCIRPGFGFGGGVGGGGGASASLGMLREFFFCSSRVFCLASTSSSKGSNDVNASL